VTIGRSCWHAARVPVFMLALIAAVAIAYLGQSRGRPLELALGSAVIALFDGDLSAFLPGAVLALFAGCVLAAGGVEGRLRRFAAALLGWLPGGISTAALGAGVLGGLAPVGPLPQLVALAIAVGRDRTVAGERVATAESLLFFAALVTARVLGVVVGTALGVGVVVPATLVVALASRQRRRRFQVSELTSAAADVLPELASAAVFVGVLLLELDLSSAAVVTTLYVIVVARASGRVRLRSLTRAANKTVALAGALFAVMAAFSVSFTVMLEAGVPGRLIGWIHVGGGLVVLGLLLARRDVPYSPPAIGAAGRTDVAIGRVEQLVGIALLAVVIVMTSVQVIAKHLGSDVVRTCHELAWAACVAFWWIAITYAARLRRHVDLIMAPARLPLAVGIAIRVVIDGFTIAFSLLTAHVGLRAAEIVADGPWAMSGVAYVLPAAFVLVALHVVLQLIADLDRARRVDCQGAIDRK
jgi:TRAP-type C4-dicarboxylate transport system permease small subunit